MKIRIRTIAAICAGSMLLMACTQESPQEQPLPGTGFAAIPGLKGGQDAFGPYEVVENWPKPMGESLPGHDDWTWSVTMDVFAERDFRCVTAINPIT